jgi:hypothetical protein
VGERPLFARTGRLESTIVQIATVDAKWHRMRQDMGQPIALIVVLPFCAPASPRRTTLCASVHRPRGCRF